MKDMQVTELLNKLTELEHHQDIEATLTEEQITEGYAEDELHPLVVEIIWLANEVLILNNGGCNWDNINELKANNFHVRAGEKDSFGWLSGIITTSKGEIMYG